MILLTWLILVAWRPFVLGFYHDDWSVIVSHPSWPEFAQMYAARPIAALTTWLGILAFGAHPFLWQVLLSVLTLGVAYGLRAFVLEIANEQASTIAALCWLVLPTTMGSTVWPVAHVHLIATIAFLWSARLIVRGTRENAAIGLWAISLFTYEAFYFQFIPVLFLCSKRPSRKLIAGLTMVQLAAIAWNRFTAWSTTGKHFASNFYLIFIGSFYRLPGEFWKAFGLVGMAGLGLLLICTAKSGNKITMICVLGMLISIAILAGAGYGLQSAGVFSRTFLVLNVWGCVAAAVVLQRRQWQTVLILACFTVAMLVQSNDWAKSWRIQQAILRSAPIEQLKRIPVGATIVLDAPMKAGDVEVFGAPWDISGAMQFTYPNLLREFTVTGQPGSHWHWKWPENTVTFR